MIMDAQSKSTIHKDNLAICYLRVSTEDQKKEGNSITIQKKAAIEYAERHNLHILEFIEEAKSASKIPDNNFDITGDIVQAVSHREKLQRIIRDVKLRKFKHLIVYDRDRLVRNLEMFVALNFFFKKHNIIIHYSKTNEAMDKETTKVNRFIELVLGSVAELEANLISVRVKEGQQQAVQSNKWPGGRTPYGYIDNNKKDETELLVPSISEAVYVKEIFSLHNNFGYSYRKIAEKMNEAHNTELWTKGKVESVICNEIYTGKIVRNRRSRKRHPELEPAIVKSDPIEGADIINDEKWDKAKKIRNVKSRIKDAKYYSTPYLLRDKLICGLCGNYMKTKSYGKDKYGNQRESIYRCATKNEDNQSELILKKSFIESAFITEFTNLLKFKEVNKLWSYYDSRVSKEISENNKNIKRIDQEFTSKTIKLSKINELLSNSSGSASSKNIIDLLENEIIMIENEISNLNKLKENITVLNTSYFKDIDELKMALERFFIIDFSDLDNEQKRILLDILIQKIVVVPNGDSLDIEIILNSQFDNI